MIEKEAVQYHIEEFLCNLNIAHMDAENLLKDLKNPQASLMEFKKIVSRLYWNIHDLPEKSEGVLTDDYMHYVYINYKI